MICSGSGRKWRPGMGRPVCPVCKRGIQSITGKQPANPTKFLTEGHTVPSHTDGRSKRNEEPEMSQQFPTNYDPWARDAGPQPSTEQAVAVARDGDEREFYARPTAPRPVKKYTIHHGPGRLSAEVSMSDGTRRSCGHNHRDYYAALKCSVALERKLNREADQIDQTEAL